MAEKILSPGVFTNEIDQSFLPATAGPIGAAIVGPTVKGPILQPTVVSSYSEYVSVFGELIQSGSSYYQFLTSHTAKEYLRQGGPLTVVRVQSADGSAARATANIDKKINASGSVNTLFTLEALGDGPLFNNFVGTGSNMGTDGLLPPRTTSETNNQLLSGSFGGTRDNFRWEVSSHNTAKGTFTLLIRQGDDTHKKKKVIETWPNLTLDPNETNYILKQIGNQTTSITTEDGVSYITPTGDYPNNSRFVRVSSLPDTSNTPNWLTSEGEISDAYSTNPAQYLPATASSGEGGSGSYGGAFGGGTDVDTGVLYTGQTAGSHGHEYSHPFKFYDNITSTNNQGILMATSNTQPSGTSVGGGYGTALSILSNKDEYDFNLLFLPGVIDQLHVIIAQLYHRLCKYVKIEEIVS